MSGLVLFETAESVIEVLWDIALAFFIIRISWVYAFLAFTTGTLVSYLFYTRLLPIHHLTTPQAELAVIPLLLAMTVIWARGLIVWYEIPRVRAFRLAIGGLAMAFLAGMEMLVALVLYEEGMGGWILETDRTAGAAFAGLWFAFGLMPTLMMPWEGRTAEEEELEEMSHGHGRKSVLSAVPTVNMSEKKGTKTD